MYLYHVFDFHRTEKKIWTVTITVLDNVNIKANQHFNLTMHCFFVNNVMFYYYRYYLVGSICRWEGREHRCEWPPSPRVLSVSQHLVRTSDTHAGTPARRSRRRWPPKNIVTEAKLEEALWGFFGQCWRVYLYKSNLQFKRKMSLQLKSL